MATIRSETAGGNWSATGTWVGGVVPGDGDRVVIEGPVTVDVNTTVGSSSGNWVAGTDSAAISRGTYNGTNWNHFNASSTFPGKLTIAAGITLTVRGDIIDFYSYATYAAGKELFELMPGATLKFDSSTTTNPSTTPYRLRPDTQNSGARPNNRLKFSGTEGNRCVITSDPGGANGYLLGTGIVSAIGLEGSWVRFERLGSASVDGISFTAAAASIISVSDAEWDSCGRFASFVAPNAAARVELTRWVFTNSLHTNRSLSIDFTNTKTTGNYLFDSCVFDKPVGGFPKGLIMRKCVFRDDVAFAGTNGRWEEMSDCLVVRDILQLGATTIVGDFTRVYTLMNFDRWNPHYYSLQSNASVGETVVDGAVVECAGRGGSLGDFLVATNPASLTAHRLKKALFLPSINNQSPAVGFTHFGDGASSDSPNSAPYIEHNTFYARNISDDTTSLMAAGETNYGFTDLVKSLKSNLVWSDKPGGSGFKILDNKGTGGDNVGIPTDNVLEANQSHNAGYNLAPHTRAWLTGAANGYEGKYSYTPGATDIDVVNPDWTGPEFYDPTRNLAAFHRDFLGHTSVDAWSDAGVAYAVGDIISCSDPDVYNGKVLNYRCKQAHSSSSSLKPGIAGTGPVGSSNATYATNWQAYWEFATIEAVAQATLTQTTWTVDGQTLTPVEALYAWVQKGWAPTNTLLKDAGHDGATIGAVAWSAGASSSSSRRRFFRRLLL